MVWLRLSLLRRSLEVIESHGNCKLAWSGSTHLVIHTLVSLLAVSLLYHASVPVSNPLSSCHSADRHRLQVFRDRARAWQICSRCIYANKGYPRESDVDIRQPAYYQHHWHHSEDCRSFIMLSCWRVPRLHLPSPRQRLRIGALPKTATKSARNSRGHWMSKSSASAALAGTSYLS